MADKWRGILGGLEEQKGPPENSTAARPQPARTKRAAARRNANAEADVEGTPELDVERKRNGG